MALTEEDRSWLEQRLEQHKCDIEALLDQQFSKLLSSRTGKGVLKKASTGATVNRRPIDRAARQGDLEKMRQQKVEEMQQQHLDGEVSADMYSTPLHHLMIDETVHDIDPKSMRGKVACCLTGFGAHFINLCVMANTVTMFVQLQLLGSLANEFLGIKNHTGWTNADIILQIVEYVFTSIFLLDLVLQLYAFRLSYFKSRFNIMDSAIVVISSLEAFVLTPLAASVGNVSVVRLLRLAKFARAFKAARTFKSFEGLRVLVAVMCFSFGSTFWSLVILFVFQVMGSIFMCQSLHDFVMDPSKDEATRAWVNDMYGDGMKSFWTIFELTFSGCWPNYARRIIEEVSPVYALFYFVYVYIVVFVATRIVAALFMKETLAQYANDADTMVKERAKKSAWIKQSLSHLFQEADSNHDGFLNEEELRVLFKHPKVTLWLKELGVDASDSFTLIELLDEGDGWMVNRDDFVHGITRLKGEARSQDLVPVYNYVKRIFAHVKELRADVDWLVQSSTDAAYGFDEV